MSVVDSSPVLDHQLCELRPTELQLVLSTTRLPVNGSLADQQLSKLRIVFPHLDFNVLSLHYLGVQREVYFVLSHDRSL